MNRLLQYAAVAALTAGAPLAHAVPQVFLVQNSGWMEPFYADPASQFKPLVAELVNAVVTSGDQVVLASGDGDFDLLLERAIQRHGVEAVVYGTPGLTALSLIRAASRYVPIEGHLLLRH